MLRRLSQLAISLLLPILASACAKRAELIEDPIAAQLQEGIKTGNATFDHATLDALLRAHVREDIGRVDYAGLKADQDKLKAYLDAIAKVELRTLPEQESKALLINAYNAYTLLLITEHYPNIKSIKDLKNPWGTKRYTVGQQPLSLDDIEHGLLRPLYKDPRIHFAVNCASISCPPLSSSAYKGATLDAQLDQAARATLQNPRYAKVEGDTLKLTSILSWYGADFTNPNFKGHAKSIPAYVAPYADEATRAFIEAAQGAPSTSALDYNWSLNDLPR